MGTVEEHESIIETEVARFVSASNAIGGDGVLVENCMRRVHWVVEASQTEADPGQEGVNRDMKPVFDAMGDCHVMRNKKCLAYDHQTATAYFLDVLFWVSRGDMALSLVASTRETVQRYLDKIATQHKVKDDMPMELHQEWSQSMYALLDRLEAFIESNFPNGLQWASPFKEKPQPSAGTVSKYRGKWTLSGFAQGDHKRMESSQLHQKQTVQITACHGSTLYIHSKVKAILIEGSQNCIVHVEDVLSSLDVMNSTGIQLQVHGIVHSVQVEQSRGIQIHLTEECLANEPEIITSNCSEVNLELPGAKGHGDEREVPVPQTFKTTIQGGAKEGYVLQTEPCKFF